jgi:endonuclease/exonuclease/phosphatase (EEP) superfamily protein YafD
MHRAGSTIALVLLAACESAMAPPARAPQEGEPALKVMTFNVNFGVAEAKANVDAIASADADIVLLQETTDEAEAVLRRELGDRYPHTKFRACCRAGGLGILSRHPIVADDYLASPIGWFPAWRFVVDTPLGEVQLLDVHLRPPVSDSGSWVKGYFTTGKLRLEEITAYHAALRDDLPTILAGDFNEDEDGDALAWLAARKFTSVLPRFDEDATTWSWPLPLTSVHARLDHVVLGPDLVATSAGVMDAGVSDHKPVVVTLMRAR